MKKYTLVRHSDGKEITVYSATAANDLVANGVARLVEVDRKAEPAKTEKN